MVICIGFEHHFSANCGYLGKQWHAPKAAFRPKAGNQTYAKRDAERKSMAAVKAKEREMKEEKEAARKVRAPSCFPPA